MGVAGEVYFIPRIGRKIVERVRFLAPVEIGRGSDSVHVDILLRASVDQRDNAASILKGRRMQQESFRKAEHCGVGADAECQGGDRHQRGKAVLVQHTQTEANVLKKGEQRSSYS